MFPSCLQRVQTINERTGRGRAMVTGIVVVLEAAAKRMRHCQVQGSLSLRSPVDLAESELCLSLSDEGIPGG